VGIRTVVLGIGNLLLTDEGAGVHAVNAFRESFIIPDDVELIDGGTMGLDLLPFIEGRDALLIVDAVDFGAESGTVRTIEGRDIKAFMDLKFSVHQIGVPDMLFAAELSGITPPRLALVGIQPDVIETGVGLSPTLSARLEELLRAVLGQLRRWGVHIQPKERIRVSGNPL
jgi:hydrogenase maturation protease